MDLQQSSEPLETTIIFTPNVAIYSAIAIYLPEIFLIWRNSRAQTRAQGREEPANKASRSWQTTSALLLYLVSVESVAFKAVPALWHLVEAYQTQYLPSLGSELGRSCLFLASCGLIWEAIDGTLSLLRMWIYKGESIAKARPVWEWSNVWIDATNGKPAFAVLFIFCFNVLLLKALGWRLGGHLCFALTTLEVYMPFILYPIYFQSRIRRVSQVEIGDLRMSIEGTATTFKFPLRNVHITTGPLQGLEKGIQLTGWPKKNSICVHEALLSSLSNDEITGLVASALGNWKSCVSLITYCFSVLFFSNLFTFVMMFIKSRATYEDFGFKHEYPMVAGIVLFGVAMAKPVSTLFSIQRNAMSYNNNFIPDKLAAENGHMVELQAALGKIAELQEESSGDWIYSLYFNGEPSISERLQRLEKIATEKALKEVSVVEKKKKKDVVDMA